MLKYLKKSTKAASNGVSAPSETAVGGVSGHTTPSAWAHSSVSTFGVRYDPPLPDLSPAHGAEALVEGSGMSLLREGASCCFTIIFQTFLSKSGFSTS